MISGGGPFIIGSNSAGTAGLRTLSEQLERYKLQAG